MTRSASVARSAPWVGIALVLMLTLRDRFELVPTRLILVVTAVVALAGIEIRWRDATASSSSPEGRALARRMIAGIVALGLLSVVLAFARAVLAPKSGLGADAVAALVPAFVGWGVFLYLPLGLAARPADAGGPVDGAVARRTAFGLAAAAFLVTWIFTVGRAHYEVIDEVLYALQARQFAVGQAIWPVEPALQRFVRLPLMVATPAGLSTQYPPGYPAILSLFVRLGVPALSGAVLAALAVLGAFWLGRRTGGPFAGVLAATLLATHELLLRWSATYMSHAAGLAALCLAAWLLADAAGRADRRGDVESVIAGLLLGIAFDVRPVTALAVGLSVWLALAARRIGWSRFLRITLMLCAGAVLPLAALLAYNAHTNGSPLRLGYQAAQGHLNDLGFGTRGILLFDGDARQVLSPIAFGLREAVRNEVVLAAFPIARDFFPIWATLPLVATAIAYRVRFRWAMVAAFSVLPIVNFFYFGNDARLHVELLPFAVVAAALIVARIREVDARAARALAVYLVGANLVVAGLHVGDDLWRAARRPSESARIARALRDSSRAGGPLVVFVRNPPLSEPLLVGLSQFNFDGFRGPVVVARDLGAENARLLCRLPGRRPLVAELDTAAHEARLLALSASVGAAARCDRSPSPSTHRPTA